MSSALWASIGSGFRPLEWNQAFWIVSMHSADEVELAVGHGTRGNIMVVNLLLPRLTALQSPGLEGVPVSQRNGHLLIMVSIVHLQLASCRQAAARLEQLGTCQGLG